MKNISKILVLFLVASYILNSQVIKNSNIWTLENYSPLLQNPPNDTDVSYRGRDLVSLKPGFVYDSRGTNYHFNGKIDNSIIASLDYQSELIDPDEREINVNLPVGSTLGEANVTPSGAFTYNIPIYCSPGTNGMQPNVSLSYNSQSTNGILGWGWSLGGLSAITRTGKDMFRDGDVLQFENLPTDNLAIDGNRLVSLEGSWNFNDIIFGTEIGNTSRIIPFGYNAEGYTSFKVETKDGSIIEYGNTADSKIMVEYIIDGVTKTCVVAWRINKVIDKFGNYMVYEYENINGENLLKRIKYTGHVVDPVLDPYASIEFYYSERADKNRKYLAINDTYVNTITSPQNDNRQTYLSENMILDKIESKYGNDVVRSYRLKYNNNKETYHHDNENVPFDEYISTNDYSMMTEITEIGEDGKQFNPIIFTYNEKESRNTLLKYNEFTDHGLTRVERDDMVFGDFNGDGIQDRLLVQRDNVHSGYSWADWHLQFGQYIECAPGVSDCGNYSFVNFNSDQNGNSIKAFSTLDSVYHQYKILLYKAIAYDLDNDGNDEIIIPYYNGYNTEGRPYWWYLYTDIYKFNGTTFNRVSRIITQTHNKKGNKWCTKVSPTILPSDYNGDGNTELLIQFQEEYWTQNIFFNWVNKDDIHKIADYVQIFDANGNWISEPTVVPNKLDFDNEDAQIIPIVLDLNKKVDILIASQNGLDPWSLYLEMNSNGDFAEKFDPKFIHASMSCKWEYQVGDLNGDGLLDLIYGKKENGINQMLYSDICFRYNTGNGFSDEKKLRDYEGTWVNPNQFLVSDFNGDGKADIILVDMVANFSSQPYLINKVSYRCYFSIGFELFDLQIFTNTESHYFPSIYYPVKSGTLFRLSNLKIMDFNGDGNADLYNNGGYGYGKILTFYSNNNHLHLKSVSDGYGNKTEIKYDIITNSNSGVYESNINSSLPLYDLKSNMYVVKDVKKFQYLANPTPNTELLQTYSYKYKNGLIHKYKGFLGFKEFITYNEMEVDEGLNRRLVQIETISQFDLDEFDKFTSNPIRNIVNVLDGTNTEMISEVEIEYGLRNLGNQYFFYESNITSHDYLKGIVKTSENIYDDWQNIIYSDEIFVDATVTIPTSIKKSFSYDNYFLIWCNSRLTSSSELTQYKDETSQFNRLTNYEYYGSNKGNALHKVIQNPGSKELTLEYDYNDFGGVIMESKSHNDVAPSTPSETRTITREYTSDGRFILYEKNFFDHRNYYNYSNTTGALLSSSDISGKVTNYKYDGFGRKYQVISPLGNTVTTIYKWSLGLPLDDVSYYKQISADNAPDSWIYYSSLGRELRIENETFGNYNVIVDKEYYKDGRLFKEFYPYFSNVGIDPNKVIEHIYDDKLRNWKTINQGVETEITYTPNSTEVKIKNPFDKGTKKIYDELGNIVESSELVSGSTVNSVKYKYNSHFKVAEVKTTVIDKPDEIITEYEYDVYGNQIRMIDKNAGEFQYDYNAFGELVWQTKKVTDVNNFVEYLFYDEIGRIKKTELKDESISALIKKTEYDYYDYPDIESLGKLKQIKLNEFVPPSTTGTTTQEINYTYDSYGRTNTKSETIKGEVFNYSYSYNSIGQLLTETYPSNVKVKYQYTNKGYHNLLRRIDGNHYDKLWELISLDPFGSTTEYRMADGKIITQKGFDNFKFPTTTVTTGFIGPEGTTPITIQNLSNTWDVTKGLLSSRDDFKNQQREEFTYDEMFRLIQCDAENKRITPPVMKSDTMKYHIDGAIKNKSDIGEYRYKDIAGNLQKPVHGVKRIGDIYNKNISYETNELNTVYNSFRKIETIEGYVTPYYNSYNRANFSYGYDESRMLVTHETKANLPDPYIETHKKYYLSNYEYYVNSDETTKEVTYISTRNGVVAAIINETGQAERTLYVHKDYLGSIQALSEVESNGNVAIVAEFSFDAWGKSRQHRNWNITYDCDASVPGFNILERGFTGHEHILQFGIINMNARIYDPTIASFLSPDNEVTDPENPQNYNRYSYALNNPMRYTDPSGNNPMLLFWAIATAMETYHNSVHYGSKAAFISFAKAGIAYGASSIINSVLNSVFSELTKNSIESLLVGVAKSVLTDFVTRMISNGKYSGENALFSMGMAVASWGAEALASSSLDEVVERTKESSVSTESGIKVNKYEEFSRDVYGVKERGADIQIAYTDKTGKYSNIRGIQTVSTTSHPYDPSFIGPLQPYNDPMGGVNMDNEPFLYPSDASKYGYNIHGSRELIKTHKLTCDWLFSDRPNRINVPEFSWSAELSIVGQNVEGNWQLLQSMKYGYDVVGDKVILNSFNLNYPMSSFSKVHYQTINSLLRGK